MKKSLNLICCIGLGLFLLSGCVSVRKEHPNITMFMLDVQRSSDATVKGIPVTLAIKRFESSSRCENKSVLYRIDDVQYETDYYNRFHASLRDVVTEEVQAWFMTAPAVNVLSSQRSFCVDYLVSGTVSECYGDVRQKDNLKAVLILTLELWKNKDQQPVLVFQKRYKETVAVEKRGASALINAFNTGLENILLSFENDFITYLVASSDETEVTCQ